MSLLSPQLSAFVAIVKNKTVHAAADELCLTQTAVTQRIRTLERSLKTTLFTRSRRGMLLTPEGEALLRYCHAAKDLEGEALAMIEGAGIYSEVELIISSPTSIMRSRVMPACLPIMQQFPNLLLHFNVNDVENRHQALRAGQCDFAIIEAHHLAKEMAHKTLAPEQYILVGSPEWKGRKLSDIIGSERMIDYDDGDRMTRNYLKHFELLELVQPNSYRVNRTDNLAFLASQGIGYTTLAKEFAKPYIEQNQLIELNQQKTFDTSPILAWYKRPEPPPYFAKIIQQIE